MTLSVKQKWALVTTVYWVLLSYMIAALIWWFIALQNQNNRMALLLQNELKKDAPDYLQRHTAIEMARSRKTAQYVGEGGTFLVLILVGAVFVFRATRKQLQSNMQQQNFMMAVTHELKTPIAVAQLNLETIQKRALTPEQQKKLIANTLAETSRLNVLCNNILIAAQLDANKFFAPLQEICLSELVEGCVEDFLPRYAHVQIEVNIEQSVYVLGDALQLQMVVNNLIENAIKYAANKPITVGLITNNRNAVLTVADLGKGIEEADRKKVFDKFYRLGDENTRQTKGTGLGLYLCKKIVKKHNGSIALTNNSPSGCIFNVLIPSV